MIQQRYSAVPNKHIATAIFFSIFLTRYVVNRVAMLIRFSNISRLLLLSNFGKNSMKGCKGHSKVGKLYHITFLRELWQLGNSAKVCFEKS